MVNWLPDVSEVDWPGSSSASIAGLLTAKTGWGDGEVTSSENWSVVRDFVMSDCQSDFSYHNHPHRGLLWNCDPGIW